jgi:uncharacterized protein (DUF4415 family)
VSAKRTRKGSKVAEVPSRGKAYLVRLRRMTDQEIEGSVPPEYAGLPPGFWADAKLVVPPLKQAVSLRVDQDVLEWFKHQGPRYQTRINAVLRSYMTQARKSPERAGRSRPRRPA